MNKRKKTKHKTNIEKRKHKSIPTKTNELKKNEWHKSKHKLPINESDKHRIWLLIYQVFMFSFLLYFPVLYLTVSLQPPCDRTFSFSFVSHFVFSLSLSLTFPLLLISPILVYPSSSLLRTIRFSLSPSPFILHFSHSLSLSPRWLTGKTAKILTTGNLCGRQRMRADTCTHVNTHRETDMRAPIIYTIITHGHTHTRKHADVHT